MSQTTEARPVVTCEGCGACCLHMGLPPYAEDEVSLLRENLPKVYSDFVAVEATRLLQLRVTGVDHVPCGFFDHVTRRCRHHEYLPDICSRFEVGEPSCMEYREDLRIREVPGER